MTLSEKRSLILSLVQNCEENPNADCALQELLALPASKREQRINTLPEKELTRYVHQHVRHRAKRVIAFLDQDTGWTGAAAAVN